MLKSVKEKDKNAGESFYEVTSIKTVWHVFTPGNTFNYVVNYSN